MTNEEIKLMALIKSDFRNFLFYIWQHLQLPAPTPIQYDIANTIQDTGTRRLIIEAFRGVGKSWITSAYVLWRLLNNPEEKFLVVSAAQNKATDFTTFTQRLITEVSFLNFLEPNKTVQRYSKTGFDVGPATPSQAPSVRAVGIGGQLTGSRATTIIADDIEIPHNSYTQDMREKLIKCAGEFEAIIMPPSNNPFSGRIIFLGTPQTEESIYNKFREKGYTTRIWPARYPSLDKLEKYNGCLAPIIYDEIDKNDSVIGMPTEPTRFPENDLLGRELSMGRSIFTLQYMLDTTLSDLDKYPLRTSDLIIMDLDLYKGPTGIVYSSSKECIIRNDIEMPRIGFNNDNWFGPSYHDKEHFTDYESSIMAIDPSGRGGDETTYVVLKILQGKLFLAAAGGFSGGYNDITLKGLADIAKLHKVNSIIIESNFGDGMFAKIFSPVLLPIYRCNIEEVRHHTQKEKRIIDTLEPVLNQHRLVVDTKVVKNDLKKTKENAGVVYSLFYQLTRITKEKGSLTHDDSIDVLAMAVKYYTDSMVINEDDARKQYKENLLDIQLEKFMESAGKIHGGCGKVWASIAIH